MTNNMPVNYMLDTNIVSHFLKGSQSIRSKIITIPLAQLNISAITEGELLFGLAKKPEATQLKQVIHEFLLRINVLPWDSTVAECYGALRADMQRKGRALGNLDMLIAAHALALEVVLVTNDQAFAHVDGLKLENWL